MRTALLYQKLEDKTVRCQLCPWQCVIAENHYGVCNARKNYEGDLVAAGYGQIVSIAPDPIEKKPLFNFYPGSRVMSVGALGCNLKCLHCQNWEISQAKTDNTAPPTRYISPEDLINLTKMSHCQGIAWTYNEPSINIEYALDGAKLAKQEGLYTVFVTNGYISEAGLDLIGPYLDAYCVDIKGWGNFYPNISKVKNIEPVLDSTLQAKTRWNMHVEVITNVIPTLNDSEEDLKHIADWVRDKLGPDTPWHISKFYPQYKLSSLPPTPTSTLTRSRQIGLEAGLTYVYTGNVPGDDGENTYCPVCHKTIIERQGYQIKAINIHEHKCTFCQAEVAVIQ